MDNLVSTCKGPDAFDDLSDWLVAIRRQHAARTACVGLVDLMAIVRHQEDNRWQMILPEISEGKDRWRTQQFDRSGFSGHSVYDSCTLAIAAAVTDGYYQRDDGALERLQDTPSFQRGNFVSDLVARINRQQLTRDHADRLLLEYDLQPPGVAALLTDPPASASGKPRPR